MADKNTQRPVVIVVSLALMVVVAGAIVMAWNMGCFSWRGTSETTNGPVDLPSPPPPVPRLKDRGAVTIGSNVFDVELAFDEATRIPGLGGRTSLPADRGMLFIFPREAPLVFWMKNCLIDLDIAFISADRRIVAIHTMKAEPLDTPDYLLKTYPSGKPGQPGQIGLPGLPAQFALEVASGELKRRGIKEGDKVVFSAVTDEAVHLAR